MSKGTKIIKPEIRKQDITINVGKLEDTINEVLKECSEKKNEMVHMLTAILMCEILSIDSVKEQLKPVIEEIKTKEKNDEEKSSKSMDELNIFIDLLKKLLD